MNSITELFWHWAMEPEKGNIIQLLNKDQIPVGAIYLDKIKFNSDNISICETSRTSEKYYLYIDGIAVFFTYYKRV